MLNNLSLSMFATKESHTMRLKVMFFVKTCFRVVILCTTFLV